MRRLGIASHISKSGRLIVKGVRPAPLMSEVLGPDMRVIGVVADVFGPVKSPYISVKPRDSSMLNTYVGKILYFRPMKRRRRGLSKGKRRRKSRYGS